MCACVHRALLTAVVLASAAATCLAQEVGLVSGRVTDERGVPMAGAIVTLSSPGMPGVLEAMADEEGRYWFRAVPGNHPLTLRAEAAGKVPVEYIGHTARRNGAVAVDFRLRSPGNHEILALVDDGVPYHQVALEGALSTMPGTVSTLTVSGRGPATVAALIRRLEGKPSAVLAVGETAARLARRHIRDVPVVFCMVPAPVDADLTTRNLCGVPLNGGFDEQLAHLRHADPRVRRVGTIYQPDRMERPARHLRDAAEAAGLKLVSAHVHSGEAGALGRAIDELRGQEIDAFLLLLEPRLMSAAGFDQIVRFTRDEGVLLAVPDPSLVVPGRSFSFTPGFWDLGAYAGALVRSIVEGRAQPADIGLVYPARVDIPGGHARLQYLSPEESLPSAPEDTVAAVRPDP